MTRIDRESFVNTLQQRPIDLSNPSDPIASELRSAGVTQTDLDRIAGADHVIHGRSEAEQLYSRLVDLEARPASGRPANIDHAARIQALAQANPAVDVITGADPRPNPSARPPVTGVFGPTRITPTLAEAMALTPPSDLVRAQGDAAARSFDAAARRNVTGPEAQAQRAIRTLTDDAVRDLTALEAQRDRLPAGSAARAELDRQIEARVDTFNNSLRSAQAMGGGSAPRPQGTQGLVNNLPPYLREAVQREGAFIPGLPGAVAPRFGGTPGVDLKFRF